MQLKKRTLYSLIAIVLVFIGWFAWSWISVPDYRVVTDKPLYGKIGSPVKVIEFADIQCPACKAANPVLIRLKSTYGDRVEFTYMHFPLRDIHPFAQKAAEGAECANDHGKFHEYIDAAFVSSPDLSRSTLISIAHTLGLPTTNFTACLDSGWKSNFVAMDSREGDRRGVQGTPTFFVNDKLVQDWSYGPFSSMIEDALKETSSQ